MATTKKAAVVRNEALPENVRKGNQLYRDAQTGKGKSREQWTKHERAIVKERNDYYRDLREKREAREKAEREKELRKAQREAARATGATVTKGKAQKVTGTVQKASDGSTVVAFVL